MIYYDDAATTRVFDECVDCLKEYNQNEYFNPSALYAEASDIKILLDKVRENLRLVINGVRGLNKPVVVYA